MRLSNRKSAIRNPKSRRKAARVHWASLVFLVVFTVVIIAVSYTFLIPAMQVASEADAQSKKQLAAHSRLLLMILLFILVAGILLTLRISRFFLARDAEKRQKTEYSDAWAEAGKRMRPPGEVE